MIAVKTLHLFPMRINQPLDSLPDMVVFARVVDAGSISAAPGSWASPRRR